MKKLLLLVAALVFVFSGMQTDVFAQKTDKELKKELRSKADKSARKEAKRLEKHEGWMVFPGGLPLEKMLEQSYLRQYQVDDNGNALYVTASGNGVATSKSAASLQAIELAKNELAGQIETRMASLVSTNIANLQLSTVDAESETKVMASAKNMVSMKLQNVEPIVKIYRDRGSMERARKIKKGSLLEKGRVEVQVQLFYNRNGIDDMAREAIKTTLKEELKDNEEDLKKLMGL